MWPVYGGGWNDFCGISVGVFHRFLPFNHVELSRSFVCSYEGGQEWIGSRAMSQS